MSEWYFQAFLANIVDIIFLYICGRVTHERQLMKCEKIRIKYEIKLKQMGFFGIFQLPNANFILGGGLHYIFIGKIGTIYGIWTT